MKHTPGPWKVLEHSWCDTSIVAESFDHCICALDINHATEESQDADAEIMLVNARLIAAAPDLFDSLQKIILAAENIGGEHVTGLGELNDRLEVAYAAIEKAKGVS